MLKLKFRRRHDTVVNSINAEDVLNFLFQEEILGERDIERFRRQTDRYEQCSELLMHLHASESPQTFVQLYQAIKNTGEHRQWLIDEIDNFCDESVKSLMKQRYSCLTGKY